MLTYVPPNKSTLSSFSYTTTPTGQAIRPGMTWVGHDGITYTMNASGQTVPVSGQPAAQSLSAGQYATQAPNNTLVQDLINELKAKQDQAYAANQKLDTEIRGGYDTMRQNAVNDLNLLGVQELSDLRENWQHQEDTAAANLQARGLAGTTIAPTLRAGYAKSRTEDEARSRERLAQQRLNTLGGIDQAKLHYLNSISNQYPDYGQTLSALQQLAYSGQQMGGFADPQTGMNAGATVYGGSRYGRTGGIQVAGLRNSYVPGKIDVDWSTPDLRLPYGTNRNKKISLPSRTPVRRSLVSTSATAKPTLVATGSLGAGAGATGSGRYGTGGGSLSLNRTYPLSVRSYAF